MKTDLLHAALIVLVYFLFVAILGVMIYQIISGMYLNEINQMNASNHFSFK